MAKSSARIVVGKSPDRNSFGLNRWTWKISSGLSVRQMAPTWRSIIMETWQSRYRVCRGSWTVCVFGLETSVTPSKNKTFLNWSVSLLFDLDLYNYLLEVNVLILCIVRQLLVVWIIVSAAWEIWPGSDSNMLNEHIDITTMQQYRYYIYHISI